MKKRISDLIITAARKAFAEGHLPKDDFPPVEVEEPKIESHGDFATNFAMLSAKLQKLAPRKIAQTLVAHIEDSQDFLDRVEIAGPGFINFFVKPEAWPPIVGQVLTQDQSYGAQNIGRGQKVQVEFVSANPTGPLHVGHGRGAAVGDSVANILAFCNANIMLTIRAARFRPWDARCCCVARNCWEQPWIFRRTAIRATISANWPKS